MTHYFSCEHGGCDLCNSTIEKSDTACYKKWWIKWSHPIFNSCCFVLSPVLSPYLSIPHFPWPMLPLHFYIPLLKRYLNMLSVSFLQTIALRWGWQWFWCSYYIFSNNSGTILALHVSQDDSRFTENYLLLWGQQESTLKWSLLWF